jgi:hypothetical protein
MASVLLPGRVAAAAPVRIRDVISGPDRPADALGRFAAALYLRLAHGEVIASPCLRAHPAAAGHGCAGRQLACWPPPPLRSATVVKHWLAAASVVDLSSFALGVVQVRASQGRRGRDTGSYVDREERSEVRAWAARSVNRFRFHSTSPCGRCGERGIAVSNCPASATA